MSAARVGVLALQGAFQEHRNMLSALGVESIEIRRRGDFVRGVDGLIIPGGESTVVGMLLAEYGLLAPIRAAVRAGLPVFGTCAGLILLSKRIQTPHGTARGPLGEMDIVTQRNAYGRQLGSFQTTTRFEGVGDVTAVFIRAPHIVQTADHVEVLARVNGKIVAVRQGRLLATAFHPELTADTRIHQYFLALIATHRTATQADC
ncbi:MAG: pyridoxal 5'-phosphate synthase glutaminase subunit PdxT [Oscillospiraceae bacterium]|jgi:5'-phosphate synthase pdxT subunit|nr:pyridoxal 5'-phosphate synthase glutaminase subunit PdxT [Oscillospiraceae bacterium]